MPRMDAIAQAHSTTMTSISPILPHMTASPAHRRYVSTVPLFQHLTATLAQETTEPLPTVLVLLQDFMTPTHPTTPK